MSDTFRFEREALSEFVEAADRRSAERVAKLALIARGRTPGHVIHAEDFGDGTWEVVYTDRPLRPDQSFVGHVRVGNAGQKADDFRFAS